MKLLLKIIPNKTAMDSIVRGGRTKKPLCRSKLYVYLTSAWHDCQAVDTKLKRLLCSATGHAMMGYRHVSIHGKWLSCLLQNNLIKKLTEKKIRMRGQNFGERENKNAVCALYCIFLAWSLKTPLIQYIQVPFLKNHEFNW